MGIFRNCNTERVKLSSNPTQGRNLIPIQSIPNTPPPFLDRLQNLENYESESKRSNWYASEPSQKLSPKAFSFSDEDIKRILKRINNSNMPTLEDDHSWREFAQQQIQGVKVFKKQKLLQSQFNS